MMLKKPNMQQMLYATFSISLTTIIFWYLFSQITLANIFALIKGISIQGVVSFIILSLSMSFFRCWRYLILLEVNGYKPGKIGLYLVTLARNFCSDLLPARLGTLVYVYLLQSRLGVPFAASAASFAISFVFDIIAFSILVILVVSTVKTVLLSAPLLLLAGSILLLCSIICLLLLSRIIYFLCTLLNSLSYIVNSSRLPQMIQHLQYTAKNFQHIRQQGIYGRLLALSLATRACKYISLYILFLALVMPLGFELNRFPFSTIFLCLGSAELAASLPISGIAGIGLYEGTWSLVFQLVGYSSEFAISTGISHHLFTQIYGYSLGSIALLFLLLQIFKSPMKEPIKTRKKPGIIFWFWFIVVTSCIFAFIQLSLFLLKNNELVVAKQSQNQGVQINSPIIDNELPLPENIIGTVIYQRPDGIFKMDIKTKNEVFLVPGGSYPRFSANGKFITYLYNNQIMVMDADGTNPKIVAQTNKPGAVCFHPDMQHVLYTDGPSIFSVSLVDLSVETIIIDSEFREMDISMDGTQIVATVKTLTGYYVKLFDLITKDERFIARGCSASFSPDNQKITVNSGNHSTLKIYDPNTTKILQKLSAPRGNLFDNHFFSNSADWLVSTSEIHGNNIFLHQLSTDKAYRLTKSGDCDRADVQLELDLQ